MRFSGLMFLVCSTVLAAAKAQSVLEQAEASFPACALKCLAVAIPASTCALTDVSCICSNAPLNAQIALCAESTCTIKELLTTQNVTYTMCDMPTRDRSRVVAYVGVVGGALAFSAFVARLISRFTSGEQRFGLDDVTLCLLVALTIPPTVFAYFLANLGLGKDMWTLPFDNITGLLYYYFMGESFYLAACAVNKVCFLLLFLRVFHERRFRIYVYVVMALSVAYGISFVFATVFQCQPISYSWNSWSGEYDGRCNNIHLQGWLSAGFNMTLDIIVIVLPLPELYKLNLSWKKKAVVMLMFSLGTLVTIVSIVRLRSLIEFANSSNVTWDYVPAAYWSTIELHVGIICVCLPAIRSLLTHIFPKVMGSTGGQHTRSGSKATNVTARDQFQKSASRMSDFIPLVDVENQTHNLDHKEHIIEHVRDTSSTSTMQYPPGYAE